MSGSVDGLLSAYEASPAVRIIGCLGESPALDSRPLGARIRLVCRPVQLHGVLPRHPARRAARPSLRPASAVAGRPRRGGARGPPPRPPPPLAPPRAPPPRGG